MVFCTKCGTKTTAKMLAEHGTCAKCKNRVKKKTIPKSLKESVWRKYFKSEIDGECFICSYVISINRFDCGHIIAESKGGKTDISNLRPVCKQCNLSMGTKNMDEFKQLFLETEVKEREKKIRDKNISDIAKTLILSSKLRKTMLLDNIASIIVDNPIQNKKYMTLIKDNNYVYIGVNPYEEIGWFMDGVNLSYKSIDTTKSGEDSDSDETCDESSNE